VDDNLAARSDPSPALFIAFHPGARSDETARRANRLTARGARYICTQIAGDLGIADLHPHRLRHTLGTLLQEQLGDARLTAETLGHAGLGSVAGYTKITAARRHAAKATIEDAGL
jgi:site-specific recombinase XerD